MTKSNQAPYYLEGFTLLHYFSLREFLNDYYQQRKKRQAWFSYRFWGNELNIDPGFLVKILQGKKKLPRKHLDSLVSFLELTEADRLYIKSLYEFENANTPELTQQKFEQLLSLRSLDSQLIQTDQYLYFSKWYVVALRSLIEIQALKNEFEEYGKLFSPPIPGAEIKRGVGILQRLNLIHKDDTGVFQITNALLTTGDHWQNKAIHLFQEAILTKGVESLKRHSPEERDISTITFTIPEKKRPELQEMIKHFRQDVLKWIRENSEEDAVYQLNLQLFPLARKGTL